MTEPEENAWESARQEAMKIRWKPLSTYNDIRQDQPANGQRVLVWHPALHCWYFGTFWAATTNRAAHFAGPPSGYITGALYWMPEPGNPGDNQKEIA